MTLGRLVSYVPYLIALAIVAWCLAQSRFFFSDFSPLWIVAALLYFIPAVVAVRRHHRQRLAITVLNVLLGWTLIGWVVALVWACTADTQARTAQ
jgi:hypothetical protein